MISQNADDWDDSVILKVFHDSLKKHVTKSKDVSPQTQSQTATETTTTSAPSSSSSSSAAPLTVTARPAVDTKARGSGEKRKRDEDKKTAAPKAVGFAAALENYVSARSKGFSQTSQVNKNTAGNKKSTPSSDHKPTSVHDENSGDKKVKFDVSETERERDRDTATHTCEYSPSDPLLFNSSSAADSSSSAEAAYDQSAWQQYYQSTAALPAAGNVITSSMIDDAMQAMLMAWYQSGYATGRYQTLCELSGSFPHTQTQTQTQEQPK